MEDVEIFSKGKEKFFVQFNFLKNHFPLRKNYERRFILSGVIYN